MQVAEFFSGDGRFSIGDRPEDRVVREDRVVVRGQEWVDQEGRQALDVRCTQRAAHRVVREDRDSDREWERARDLGKGRLERAREWVVRQVWRRLRVKRRVRRVLGREAGDGHGTRRPKKAR
jgi:hypothetical protein